MEVAPYLFFNGRCEEALAAYAKIFDGKILTMMRFAEAPPSPDTPASIADNIMHATFEAPGVKFMACDAVHGPPTQNGNVAMSVGTADATEGGRIFNALAEGGTITMPFEKMFWGATFGQLIDAYGIAWMVNAG